MKRKFTYLLTALALLAFLSPTTAWGGVKLADTQRITQKTAHETMLGVSDGGEMTRTAAEYIFNTAAGLQALGITAPSTGQGTNLGTSTFTVGGITMSSTDGSTATRIWNSNGTYSLRVYKGNNGAANGTLTFAASQDNVISQIVVSGTGTLTANTGTYTNGTWTGSASSVTFTCTANATISTITVTYSGGSAPTTYTVTYAAGDHGTGTMTDSNSPYEAGDQVTLLSNTFTPDNGYQWDAWEVKDANDNTVSVNNGTFTMPASDVTVTAQWTQSGGGSGTTATINFGSASGSTNINSASVTGTDSQNNTWTITTVGTTSFTPNSAYAQVGSSSKPATSITFTTTLPQTVNITAFSAKFGGFSGTAGDIALKVGSTTLGTGSLDGTNDVTVTNSSNATGNVLTVTVTNISKGVKCYFISYTYEVSTTPMITINPSTIDFGNVVVGEQISQTFTVAQANLTADIALSASIGSLNPSTILQGAAATQVTWTYTPATAGTISETITATSGTLSETLNITGLAKEVHNITIASMTNGTVTASPSSAVEGETITLTVTPNTGYTLDALTVTNTTTSLPVTVTNNTFEMPDAPVTVSATFSAIQIMTVAEALDPNNTYPMNNVYVRGIVSDVNYYSQNNHYITYYISADGTTTSNQLEVYRGKGLNGADFASENDLMVGDQVVVYGNLVEYTPTGGQTIIEFDEGNYLYSLSRPSITVNPDVISLAANETESTTGITITDITISEPWDDCQVTFYTDVTGATVATQPEWVIDALVAEDNNDYLVSCAVYANEGPARTAYFKVYAYDAYQNAVYSNMVTLTQAAVFAPAPTTSGWVLTALEDIVPGDVFVIVGNNGDDYAMTNDNGTQSAPTATAVTVNDNVLAADPVENLKWNLDITNDGYVFYPNGSTTTWLYCTNTNNGVRVGTGEAKHFSMNEDGYLTTTETTNQRYLGVYNSQDWRCYDNTTGNIADQSFAFYKYSNVTTYTKTIQPYSGNGGYVLIAAPVEGVAPTAANGFLTNNYDLYRFDQSRQEEWLNYKAEPFYLIPGKGYLYANSGNNGQATTLTFTGTPYTGNGQITLTNDANADFAGWNLIGNPYATGMVLKDANNGNKAFYTLNPAGNELMAGTAGTEIAAMEGVFVEATTDGEEVSFVEETGGGGAGGGGFDFISLNVSRNRGASAGSATIDRAIIGIGDGPMLHKFQLNPSNTKIYITEANQDYAIVRSANEAELPVSFRASENGTYTISVETRNVKMDYLHLIDNMTGADVDLLATPSYTFEAKTSDYASRFRLMFSANSISEDADGDNAFAYFNGSNWTISNMGEATLQVVDVMGRVLSSETLSGNAEVNINQPTGVYMLRLVSGDSVKVQKVVVR